MGEKFKFGKNSTFVGNQFDSENNELVNNINTSEIEKTPNKEESKTSDNETINKEIRKWKRQGNIVVLIYIIILVSAFVIQYNECEFFGITKQNWIDWKKTVIFEIIKYAISAIGVYGIAKLIYDRNFDPSKEKAKRDLLKSK